MKKFLLLALISTLAIFSTANKAVAEDAWKLTPYKSFTFNPKSGRLSIKGQTTGSYAVKLEVNLPEGKDADYCKIKVLIVYGTETQFQRYAHWEASVNLIYYRPPFPNHILERERLTGFRPQRQLPIMNLLKKYKGVDIEGMRLEGRGDKAKLKRSIIRLDFSQMLQDKEKE